VAGTARVVPSGTITLLQECLYIAELIPKSLQFQAQVTLANLG